jgi:glycosyltransferase involved in cell wall biosynthesis
LFFRKCREAVKVAIVSQYYRPEVVHIPYTLAEGLAARGHSVRVVTGYPNYPDGRLFAGFRQRWRRVERDRGVTIRRVPLVISHSTSAPGRLASYLSFALSSLSAWRFVRAADVVYVYGAQPTAALGAYVWKRLSRKPFVLHSQDLWPESVTGSSMVTNRITKRVVGSLLTPMLRHLYRTADATIAIAPGMARILLDRGAPERRLRMLFNWADEEALTELDTPSETGDSRATRFTYAGNLGDHQDLSTLLDAAALLRDDPDISIRIVGSGIAEGRLKERSEALRLTNVEFVGRVPLDSLPAVYATTDFQIVSLTNQPIFSGTIPSKLQSGLMAGLPVIASIPGDVSSVVATHRLGFTSTPESAESMAATIRHAASLSLEERRSMSERCRAFYENEMSRDSQIDRIADILRSVVLESPRVS